MLQQHHYRVIMFDEKRTSKACADCGINKGLYAVNEAMYTTDSPRPWRVEPDKFDKDGLPRRCRQAMHGLTRCTNCGLAHCRDDNAVRNMRVLVRAALRNEPRPAYLDSLEKVPEAKAWKAKYKSRARRTTKKPRAHSRNQRLCIKERAKEAAKRAAEAAEAARQQSAPRKRPSARSSGAAADGRRTRPRRAQSTNNKHFA